MNTWLMIIITEAIATAQAFVTISTLKPGIKAALGNFIQAGEAVVIAIQVGA